MTTWKIDIPPRDSSPIVHLVTIRHGQTSWNAAGLIQGQQGPGLDAAGTAQARGVAQQLLEHYPNPDLVVSSDLTRCLDTAAPYVSQLELPLLQDPRLREIDNGDWSGHTTAQVAVDCTDTIDRIRRGEDLPRGGGETTTQLRSRTRAFTDELRIRAAQHGSVEEFTVVAFSHGGTIRALFAEALQVPDGLQLFGPVHNCAVSLLQLYGDDTAVVSQYNHNLMAKPIHQLQES